MVAGRFLPEQLHEVARLLDGLILDTSAVAITAEEVVVAVPELGRPVADQVVQAADGSVKLVVTALDQWRRQPNQDPVAIVAHVSRSASAAALQELDGADRVLVGLLARTPGVDQSLLASLGGPDFVWRALEAGIPLAPSDHRRHRRARRSLLPRPGDRDGDGDAPGHGAGPAWPATRRCRTAARRRRNRIVRLDC